MIYNLFVKVMKKYPFKKPINDEELTTFLISLGKKTIKFINNSSISRLKNKSDGTDLSEADLKLDKILFTLLKNFDPSITIISEERDVKKETFMKKSYWLVDPIDGTTNYVNGGNEFTINVALINNGIPIIGLIAHPPTREIWVALKKKVFIYDALNDLRKTLFKKPLNINNPGIIISKEENIKTHNFIKKIKNKKIIYVSSSLKFCYLAAKRAILYPRFSVIKKWDIAAGHAILRASGGELTNIDGTAYKYNYPSELSKEFFAFSLKSWRKTLNLQSNIN